MELGASLREIQGNADIPATFVSNEFSVYGFEWVNEEGRQYTTD